MVTTNSERKKKHTRSRQKANKEERVNTLKAELNAASEGFGVIG